MKKAKQEFKVGDKVCHSTFNLMSAKMKTRYGVVVDNSGALAIKLESGKLLSNPAWREWCDDPR